MLSDAMSPERHMRLSLALAALFLAMGLWLEAMIGLRMAGWVDDPLRREFLRLGHAHGGLLALLNLALPCLRGTRTRARARRTGTDRSSGGA